MSRLFRILLPLGLVIASGAWEAPTAVSQRPPALLSGRVLDAETGRAVAQAIVTLNIRPLTSAKSTQETTSTDAEGRFSFEAGSDSSRGTLAAQAAGYLPGHLGQQGPLDIYAAAGDFDVQASTRSQLGIRLWREGSIRGTVRNESGELLAGAEVSVWAKTYTGVGWRWTRPRPRVEKTDDQGFYRMGQLRPGTYIVAAKRSARDSRTTFSPDAPSLDGAVVLPLGAGADAVADVSLVSLPAGRLSVAVEGSGSVVSGLKLRLTRLDAAGQAVEPAELVAESAQNGRFDFADVPAGQYNVWGWLFPTAERLYTVSGDFSRSITFNGPKPGLELPARPIEPTWVVSQQVDVDEHQARALSVALRPGATVSGRVVFDGQSSAPTAAQLPTIPVEIRPADGRDVGPLPQGRIEKDGTFRSVGLPPGDYVMRVQPGASGFGAWSMVSVRVGGRETLGSAFHVEAADVSGVVIGLSDVRAVIAGVVRGSNGPLDSPARVIVFPQSRDLRARYSLFPETRLIRQAFVQGDGRFQAVVPEGSYYVVAVVGVLPEFWMAPEWLETTVRHAQAVSVKLGETQQTSVIAVDSPPWPQ